jgi:DNA-binding NtrC family response regulator
MVALQHIMLNNAFTNASWETFKNMARVVVFEDNSDWQLLFEQLLAIDGHTVIGRATTVAEANRLIKKLGPKAIDVGLVDGNLSQLSVGGNDGAKITQQLQAKFTDVLVIGVSVDGFVAGADANVSKGDNPKAINDIIAHRPRYTSRDTPS